MNNSIKTLLASLLIIFAIFTATSAFADTPPPPPSGGHGAGGNAPPGGGAPVGEGIFLLTVLASGYGIIKRKTICITKN